MSDESGLKFHVFAPDLPAMGDCLHCGHVREQCLANNVTRAVTALTAQAERIAEMEAFVKTAAGPAYRDTTLGKAARALADAQAMADKYKADTIDLNAAVTELEAAKAQAEEDAHYANGVTDLALQRRDTAEAQVAVLAEALDFYGTAETYHAVTVLADRPAGGFADDFDENHGDDFYKRPLPGKKARDTLASLPDSAAKLRAVVDAAVEGVAAQQDWKAAPNGPVKIAAYQRLRKAGPAVEHAVAALQASRTE